MLKQGDSAIDFSLPDSEGRMVSLKDFTNKKVVLYFYPKDDTPGCTKEACGFRDIYDYILAEGAVVIGISPDDSDSHLRFKGKYNLPFYLLSDPRHEVAESYGVWGEKSMYGKTYMGIIRSTFIIDGNGIIARIFPKVTPEGHGDEVLDALKEI